MLQEQQMIVAAIAVNVRLQIQSILGKELNLQHRKQTLYHCTIKECHTCDDNTAVFKAQGMQSSTE